MRPRFFRILGEEDLMDAVFNIMNVTGAAVDLNMDLRQLLYLNNKIEEKKAAEAKQNQRQMMTSNALRR